jgi:hypothetical protein
MVRFLGDGALKWIKDIIGIRLFSRLHQSDVLAPPWMRDELESLHWFMLREQKRQGF